MNAILFGRSPHPHASARFSGEPKSDRPKSDSSSVIGPSLIDSRLIDLTSDGLMVDKPSDAAWAALEAATISGRCDRRSGAAASSMRT